MSHDQEAYSRAATALTRRTFEVLPGVWWKLWYCARLQRREQQPIDPNCEIRAAHGELVRTILQTPLSDLVRDAEENGAEGVLLSQTNLESMALGSLPGLSRSHFNFVASSVRARLRGIGSQESPISFQPLMSACSYAEAIGFSIRDSRLRFIGLNAAAETMLGTDADHCIGKTSREVMGPIAEAVEEILAEVVATGRAISAPVSGRMPGFADDGEWMTQYFPIKGADRRVSAIAAVIVEVTNQRKLEKRVSNLGSGICTSAIRTWATDLRDTLMVLDLFVDHSLSNIIKRGTSMGRVVALVRSFDQRLIAFRDLVAQQSRLVPQ